MSPAKPDPATLQAIGSALDSLMVEESATDVADVLGCAVSTVTRRNEGDKLRTYPLADGLIVAREYRREFPALHQRVSEYLSPEIRSSTSHLSIGDRAEAAMRACAAALEELIPLARLIPTTESERSRTYRCLAEVIRDAQKLRNAMDAEAAKRGGRAI